MTATVGAIRASNGQKPIIVPEDMRGVSARVVEKQSLGFLAGVFHGLRRQRLHVRYRKNLGLDKAEVGQQSSATLMKSAMKTRAALFFKLRGSAWGIAGVRIQVADACRELRRPRTYARRRPLAATPWKSEDLHA